MSASKLAVSGKRLERARAERLGPEKRRPLVLDVAFELFLRHGYRGTSMEAIARAAGVSKPVIYDCFASKADLFGALLDREEQRMLAQFSGVLASSARSQDVPTMLADGFVSMLHAVRDTPELYRIALLGLGGEDAAIEARVRHGRSRHASAIAELARAWLTGRLEAERLDAVARFAGEMLVAIGEAGVRTLLGDPEQWTPDALGAMLARQAAGGFAALLAGADNDDAQRLADELTAAGAPSAVDASGPAV